MKNHHVKKYLLDLTMNSFLFFYVEKGYCLATIIFEFKTILMFFQK